MCDSVYNQAMNYKKLRKGEIWIMREPDPHRWLIVSHPKWGRMAWNCSYKDLNDGRVYPTTNFCGELTGKEYYGWVRTLPKYVSHFIKICR